MERIVVESEESVDWIETQLNLIETLGLPLYLSGQISHDEAGNIVGNGDMSAQMRQAYANVAKLLGTFGASMDNVVDEIMYVTDLNAAFTVAGEVRREAYGGKPAAANTLIKVAGLAFPELMIEVKCTARV